MEIIKPGKVRKIKLQCDECGCEFTCNLGELTRIYGTLWAECPQEGCHNVVEVPNGAPEYIVPEKQDNAAGTVAADLPMVSLIETLRTMGGGIIPLPHIQANSTNRSDT